jgi:hypothetical protein
MIQQERKVKKANDAQIIAWYIVMRQCSRISKAADVEAEIGLTIVNVMSYCSSSFDNLNSLK